MLIVRDSNDCLWTQCTDCGAWLYLPASEIVENNIRLDSHRFNNSFTRHIMFNPDIHPTFVKVRGKIVRRYLNWALSRLFHPR